MTTVVQHATSRSLDGLNWCHRVHWTRPASSSSGAHVVECAANSVMLSFRRGAKSSEECFHLLKTKKRGEASPVTDNYRPMEINLSLLRINKKTPMKTFNRKMHRCYFNKHSKNTKTVTHRFCFQSSGFKILADRQFKFTVLFLEHVAAESLVEVVSLVSLWACVHTLTVSSPEAECPCRCAFCIDLNEKTKDKQKQKKPLNI